MFLIQAARNLADLGRELLNAIVVHLIPDATIDQAVASPLIGHHR